MRRVAFVRSAQRVGLSLEEIAEATGVAARRSSADQGRLDPALPVRGGRRIDAQIERLERLRDRLDSCIGCGCLSLARCSLSNPDDVLSEQGPGAYYLDPSTIDRPGSAAPTLRTGDRLGSNASADRA